MRIKADFADDRGVIAATSLNQHPYRARALATTADNQEPLWRRDPRRRDADDTASATQTYERRQDQQEHLWPVKCSAEQH